MKKQRSLWWAITLMIIVLVLALVGVLWFLHEVGIWSLTTGLNIECSDVLCEMRRPLEFYKA